MHDGQIKDLPAKEPDRAGSLAPALASPIAPILSFFVGDSLRQSLAPAPSVTPGSRRGHPNSSNRLAEHSPVPPWALLAHTGPRWGAPVLGKKPVGLPRVPVWCL